MEQPQHPWIQYISSNIHSFRLIFHFKLLFIIKSDFKCNVCELTNLMNMEEICICVDLFFAKSKF